jgi:serine/threonine protein kinase
VSDFPNYKTQFPKWRPQSLAKRVPRLCPKGVDLLSRLLAYEPTARITCKEAQCHPYFADLPKQDVC